MNPKLMIASLAACVGALVAYGEDQQPSSSNSSQYQNQGQASPSQGQVQPQTMPSNSTMMQPGPAASDLDVEAEAQAINQASFDNRNDMLKDVKTHVGRSHRTLIKERIKNDFHMGKLSDDMKAQYKAAKESAKSDHKDLEARIKNAEESSSDTWESNRTALVQAYQQYAEAVSHEEMLAQGEQPAAQH
jgi:hypothetical protein